MTVKDEKKRTTRLNVRLQSEIMDKMDALASEMGLPASTLGAVAIAEYVNGKLLAKRTQTLTAKLSADKVGEIMEGMFNNPEMLALLASSEEQGDQPRLEGV